MAQRHLDNPDIDAAFQQVRGEAVAQRVNADALDGPAALTAERHAEWRTATSIGLSPTSGKQPRLGSREPPICPQDTKELRRQHHRAVPGSLAVADLDQHSVAVEIGNLEAHRFRGTQTCRIGRRQRRARLERRDGLQKPYDSSALRITGNLRGVRA